MWFHDDDREETSDFRACLSTGVQIPCWGCRTAEGPALNSTMNRTFKALSLNLGIFLLRVEIGTTGKIKCIYVSHKLCIKLSGGQADWNRASGGVIKNGPRTVNIWYVCIVGCHRRTRVHSGKDVVR